MRPFSFLSLTVVFLPFSAVFACSSLTAPPSPEPIASETVVASAARPAATPPASAAPVAPAVPDAPPGKLEITDIVAGKGAEVKSGDSVSVQYTGTLTNGTQFDSSRTRKDATHPDGTPFDFTVGRRSVIEGWDKGLVGMKVGGKRKLVIPYQMAYGDRGSPPKIPPKSDLVFEIELLSIKPSAALNPQAPLQGRLTR